MSANNRRSRASVAQHKRWAALTPEQKSAATARGRYAADTRWEREADPDGRLTAEQRAVAGARLRDEHYRRLGVVA